MKNKENCEKKIIALRIRSVDNNIMFEKLFNDSQVTIILCNVENFSS